MKKVLAIMWTSILVMSIIYAAVGIEPTWLSVFCPLICLVLQRWSDVFKKQTNNKPTNYQQVY